MIPHMTPENITKEINKGNAIFDNGYEAFYTALAKTNSLDDAAELANSWGFNSATLNTEWLKALKEARANFLDD